MSELESVMKSEKVGQEIAPSSIRALEKNEQTKMKIPNIISKQFI